MTTSSALSPAVRARLIATSFFALFAIVGFCLYGLPFYYNFYFKDLGWSRTEITWWGNAIGKLIVGPLFGFLVGWMIERIGPRKPMVVGILLAGTALVGLSGVQALPFFVLFYFLNSLAYVTAGPLPNQVLLSRMFDKKRGTAMGIAYVGLGLGGYVANKLSPVLVGHFDWRTALKVMAAIVVGVSIPLVLFLREGDGASVRKEKAALPSLKSVLGSRYFYLLALGSMASIGAVGGTYQNLKFFLAQDLKFNEHQAGDVMANILFVSLAGRVAAGWLADKLGPKRVMLIVYTLVTSAIVILLAGPKGNAIYLFVVVFGLGLGGEYLIIPLMAGELFGTAVLGRVMGIILTADGVAEGLIPVLVGWRRDATGSYSQSFQILTLLAALGAVAITMLPSRQKAQAAPAAPQG